MFFKALIISDIIDSIKVYKNINTNVKSGLV